MVDYSQNIDAALDMLDLFASVGAKSFDLTFKKLDENAKQNARKGQSVGSFKNSIPHLVPSSFKNCFSLIARPRSEKVGLVQLDDLNTEKVKKVEAAAFLCLETSPKNYQAWLAIEGEPDEDFNRRLKQGIGADVNASGATRWAGTANFKTKYAPNFPIVTTIKAERGLVVQKAALEALGLVAAPKPVHTPENRPQRPHSGRPWPSYAECMAHAPEAYESGRPTGKPDVSRVDFAFSIIAADWGRSEEEIALRLMQLSSKAKDPAHGLKYAAMTARNAALRIQARKRGLSL